MKEKNLFLFIGIAPPILYWLDIIKTEILMPIIILSALGFTCYAFLTIAIKCISAESKLIDKVSEIHNIPRDEFEKVFDDIYHSNSGISNEERIEATLNHFKVI
jgi:hypothetical protein